MNTTTITTEQRIENDDINALPARLVHSPQRRPKYLPLDVVRTFHPKPTLSQPLRPFAPQRSFAADRVQGWISRDFGGAHLSVRESIEVALPPGTPRYINAATLKRLLGGNRKDRLLQKSGDSWSICDDGTVVDLSDASVEFRLGPVSVYS